MILSILPRQGEVAPKVTEGEGTHRTFRLPPPPTGKGQPPPLAGEDRIADLQTKKGGPAGPPFRLGEACRRYAGTLSLL